jgi:hypothetical protein
LIARKIQQLPNKACSVISPITQKKHRSIINKEMKDAKFPKFGTPNNFIDLSDVVKLHAKQDALWTEESAKIADARLRKVQQFSKHLIRAQTMLQ